MSRPLRIALVALAVLVVVRIALPFALRPLLASQLSAALGRPVAVDTVRLAFARGAAGVEGLRVGEGEQALLRVERAGVNLHVLKLLTGEVRVEEVELVSPAVALRLFEDGTLEPVVVAPDEPAEPLPEEEAAPAEAEAESEPWPVHVDDLLLSDLTVLLVPEGDAEAGLARFDLGLLELGGFSLVSGHLDFGSVRIEKPRLSVARDIQLAPPGAGDASPAAEPAPESQSGPLITGSELTIDDAAFELDVGQETVSLLLDLAVRDVSFAAGERFPLSLRVDRQDGFVEFEGQAGVQPVALAGDLKLENLTLKNLLALADPEIAARIEQGRLSGKLALDVGIEDSGPRAAVNGDLSLAELAGHAEGRHLVSRATRLTLGDFSLRPGAAGAPALSARRVALELDGLGLRDDGVDPPALVELPEVRVETRGVRLPERDLALDLRFAGLGGTTGTSTSRLSAGTGKTEIQVDGFPIGPFSGYARGAGFLLNRGSAHLKGEIDSAGSAHQVGLDVTVEDLEIETVDEGLFEKSLGMSPGLALAVLEDPTGSVSLPLALSVDTESGDAGVSVAQLLTGALRQALMGIATAPLKGLGVAVSGVVGSDGRLEMDPVQFEAGSSRWVEGQEDYIQAMVRTLEARPLAGLRIVGRASEEEARRPERLAEKRARRVHEAILEAGADPAALEVAPPVVASDKTGVVFEVGPRPAVPANQEG